MNDILEIPSLEERFKILERAVSATSNGILITDPAQPDNPIIYVNPSFERITGYQAEEIIGKNCRFLQGTDRNQPILEDLRAALREGRDFHGVLRNYKKNGELFWNELTISPVRDESGQITHFVGIAADISKRVLLQSELHKTTNLLSSIIENMPAMVVLKDAHELRFELLNKEGEDLLGYKKETFLGKNDYDFFPPEQADFFTQKDRETLQEKTLKDIPEEFIQTREKGIRVLHTKKVPILDMEGSPAYLLLISEDITQKKLAEEALQRAYQELENEVRKRTAELEETNQALQQQIIEREKMEEALKSSESKFRRLFDSNIIGILFADIYGNVFDANQAFLDIVGYSLDDFTKQHLSWKILNPPEFLDQSEKAIKTLQEKGIYGPYEKQLICKNGHRADVLLGHALLEGSKEKTVCYIINITQQKQLDQELRKNEKRLRCLVDSNIIGINFTSINGKIKDANDAFLNMVGYTREELQAGMLCWRKLTLPEYRYLDEIAIEEFKERGVITPYEKQFLHKNGSRVDVLIGAARPDRVKDEAIGFILDITQQKQFEKALQESQERYKMVEQATHDIIWDWDLLTNKITWNKHAYKKLGHPQHEEPQFSWWLERIHPEDKNRVASSLHKALQSGKSYWCEEYRFSVKNTYLTVLDRGYIVHDENGIPIRMIGAATDITYQKQTEIALSKSFEREKFIRSIISIISQSFDSKIALDSATQQIANYFQVDRCLLMHYEKQEDLTLKVKLMAQYYRSENEILPVLETDIPHRPPKIENSSKNNVPPYTIHLSSPEAFPQRLQTYAQKYGIKACIGFELFHSGHPYGFFVLHQCTHSRQWTDEETELLRNICDHLVIALYQSDLYLAEQHAKDEATLANRRKDEFLAGISHEFRTPLNAIIGFSEMFTHGMAGIITEKQKKYASNIALSGHHLLDMVNDILDIAKIEAGHTQIFPEWVKIAPLLTEVENMLQEIAAQKKIHIEYHLEPNLKQIYADPGRLRQILYNLLSNAIKFNHIDGKVFLRIFPSSDQQWVICEVEDTGVGIPKANLPNLFQEFYQAGNRSVLQKHEGTGLGLCLVKRFVELHGGTITVESEEGVGSTFRFMLSTHPPEKQPNQP